jgi:ankyrin repeat protein
MSAVSAGREEAVAALLAGGADVSAKNSSGQTALHYAVRACCCLMHTRSQGLSS